MSKLLFIRYKKAKDILEGGEQGSQKNHNVLSKVLGTENITTYYIHDESKKKTIKDYLVGVLFFFQNYFFGLSKQRVGEIVEITSGFDIVFIDRSTFGIIARELKRTGYKGLVISFFHNVERIYFADKIAWYKPWRNLVVRCADKNDAYACRYSDKIIALNPRDAQEIEQRYKRKADVLIPVAFKDSYRQEKYPEEKTSVPPLCLFLGAYFTANAEGIKWFIEEVYPHVSIRLKIVGKNMIQLKKDITLPKDIELISDAPSLKPYFEEADIMILPIFKGSGMKVKTCESLMYGKNIIATSESFEGYEVDYDRVGGLCNTKEEFIARINDFIASPRPRFNAYSRRVFLEKYSEEAVEKKFREVLL